MALLYWNFMLLFCCIAISMDEMIPFAMSKLLFFALFLVQRSGIKRFVTVRALESCLGQLNDHRLVIKDSNLSVLSSIYKREAIGVALIPIDIHAGYKQQEEAFWPYSDCIEGVVDLCIETLGRCSPS